MSAWPKCPKCGSDNTFFGSFANSDYGWWDCHDCEHSWHGYAAGKEPSGGTSTTIVYTGETFK